VGITFIGGAVWLEESSSVRPELKGNGMKVSIREDSTFSVLEHNRVKGEKFSASDPLLNVTSS